VLARLDFRLDFGGLGFYPQLAGEERKKPRDIIFAAV